MPSIKVPLQGAHVVAEGEGPAVNGTPTPDATPATPETPQTTTGRSLHNVRMPRQPQVVEDVSNMEFVHDQFGRAKLVMKQAQEPEAAELEDSPANEGGDGSFVEEPPPSGTQAQPTTQPAPDSEVSRLTRMVELLVSANLQGKPLTELLNPPAPAAPTPPDPSQVDWYDPQQVADFHRANAAYTDALVQHRVNAALEPHQEALADSKWQRQYNSVLLAHGKEPNFKENADTAISLVGDYGGRLTIQEAYDIVSRFRQEQPIPSPQPQQAAPSSRPQQPARTMTPEQADIKAAQAQRLPKPGNGVSSAGQPALPANVKTLGAIMAWNRQHGRA